MGVTIFTSKNCPPCKEVDRLVKEGKFGGEGEVELVDIETEEGFERFSQEVLSMGDGAVPTAYKEGKKCVISITDNDSLIINCPGDSSSSD